MQQVDREEDTMSTNTVHVSPYLRRRLRNYKESVREQAEQSRQARPRHRTRSTAKPGLGSRRANPEANEPRPVSVSHAVERFSVGHGVAVHRVKMGS
jgi:hypothetical protein